jgi:spore coat protein A
MKKLVSIFTVISCLVFFLNAQDPLGCVILGTPGVTMDPGVVPKFVNDLPVINDLGLRIDLTQGTLDPLSVKMEQTTQDLLGMGFQTTVWGYRFPDLPATYPGATIVAMRDAPIEIKWKNKLPGHFLPVDASMHMAHPANIHDVAGVRAWYAKGNVPTVAHLHGGHTESASDGLPEAWFTQRNQTGAFFVKKNYLYHNDQEAATLWYHDHALGITRLNVYAGLAGFYLLRDDNENALINNGVLPGGDYEIEIVIQDRLFDQQGQLFWPSYPGETPYDDFIFGEGAVLPGDVFPNGGPSALAEFFGNIILVNGKAWPKLDVEPRKYRFRLLNGSDSRFYVLKFDNNADMMIIGTDVGLLDSPVTVNELVFAPGERYDVVVDFTGMETQNITMVNLGPDEPYGGGVPGVDFDPACPETTGQIMQFKVTKPMSAVPNATVSLGTTLNSISRFDPLLADNAGNPRKLVLFEGKDEYGRLQPMLGTLEDGSQTWFEPISENPNLNSTEIWEVYNATGDAHPIHLHLVKFQILNREEFTLYEDEGLGIEENIFARPQIQHNGSYGTGGVFFLDPLTPLVADTETDPMGGKIPSLFPRDRWVV